jgi:DNA polymerase-3 subunit alpha
MQIVRDLAGYSMGRSDLVRRAMSKKKTEVMAKERQNFVYGNPEEGVAGCIANGISERVANKIYDDMTDFAKYAFNKSHAAAYAVVAYQTAYLKCYFPVEFMAALMTSVLDSSAKVSEYIMVCRDMGIEVLPPDVNEGQGKFSVVEGRIRYGMYAIKSIGRPVVDCLLAERQQRGNYKTLEDFLTRINGREINKRAVENLIKAGAMDSLWKNRRQMMMVYGSIMDRISSEKKNSMAGQMTLFDIAEEDVREEFQVRMPPVAEFEREELLNYEKEVLGVYISGHPLEGYLDIIHTNATASSGEFALDEETGKPAIKDGTYVVVGGMITVMTTKYTRTNQMMAFLTVEDLTGTIEVVVFPKTFDAYRHALGEDKKVLILGRAQVEDEKEAKLIAQEIHGFDEVQKELWVQFASKQEYEAGRERLLDIIRDFDGNDPVVIYVASPRAIKRLPANWNTSAADGAAEALSEAFGEKNVKVIQKNVEFQRKRY